tara:strand:+ start:680 stop:991 length:312 start_codon:yes stop_codon:yes gene_type:complete
MEGGFIGGQNAPIRFGGGGGGGRAGGGLMDRSRERDLTRAKQRLAIGKLQGLDKDIMDRIHQFSIIHGVGSAREKDKVRDAMASGEVRKFDGVIATNARGGGR